MKRFLTILFTATLTISVFGQNPNNQIELIKSKMTKETVVKIMGQPSFINFDNGEGTWTKGTKEIWLYGAECQKCYAKHGSIYFDSLGLVQYVYDNKAGNDGLVGHTDTTFESLIYKGQLVELYIEKAIFHCSTNSNFLLKFTIKNISNKTVGVDLTDYWKVIYPNQWGIYKKPYREVIDETTIIPDTIINRTELLKKFNNSLLTMIKPNATLDYYRDWNGSGEKIELKNAEEYLIISVDGLLLFTNGNDFESITLLNADERNRIVVFGYPINNKAIPEKSLIINKK